MKESVFQSFELENRMDLIKKVFLIFGYISLILKYKSNLC